MNVIQISLHNINCYIENFPSDLIKDLKKELSFQYEEYLLGTRVIVTRCLLKKQEASTKIAFPTGLLSKAQEFITKQKMKYEVVDKRTKKIPNPLPLNRTLREYQRRVVNQAMLNKRGIIKVATGGGKTSIGAAIIAKVNCKTMFCVHTSDLLIQAYDELTVMLGVELGIVGGGVVDIKQINICMIQTLHRAIGKKYVAVDEDDDDDKTDISQKKQDIIDMINQTDCIIIDEVQHLSSDSYVNLMTNIKRAYFRFGLCLEGTVKIRLADGRNCTISGLYANNIKKNLIINVMTFNMDKNILEPKRAKILKIPIENKIIYKITILDHNNELIEIKCSEKHSFYIPNKKKFVMAKDLDLNDNVNIIEKIVKKCKICGKVMNKKTYCSKKCLGNDIEIISNMYKGHKKWVDSLTEEEKREQFEKFQKAGTKQAKDNWKIISDEERERRSQVCRENQVKLKEKDYAKYIYDRTKSHDYFRDPERISKQHKAIWAKTSKKNRKKRCLPWIKAGIAAQVKLRKEGKLGKYALRTYAKDGHLCDSQREAYVDNWLSDNNIPHKNHPFIEDTYFMADFLVIHEGKKIYIEYDGLNRGKDYYKYDIYRERELNFIILENYSKTYLKEKLTFLLFEDPLGKVIKKEIITIKDKWLYDLTILDTNENNHNYFANDVLVHNSGTPWRDNGIDMLLEAYAGREICNITASYLIQKGYLVRPTIYMIPSSNKFTNMMKKRYTSVYKKYIVDNKERNGLIIKYTKELYEAGRTILITITQIKHGEIIKKMLIKDGIKDVELIVGKIKKEKRKELFEKMKSGKLKIAILTSLGDEGLDIPCLDALILAGSGKSPIKIPQRVGRVVRLYPGKENAVVIDFYDRCTYLLGHSNKRLALYKKEPEFIVKEFLKKKTKKT